MSLGPLDPFNPPWAVPLDVEGFSGLVAEGDSTFSQASEAIDHPPTGVTFSAGLSRGLAGSSHELPAPVRGTVTHTRRATDVMVFEHTSGGYGAAVYGGHVVAGTSVLTGRKDLTGPGIKALVASSGRVEMGTRQSTRPAQECAATPCVMATRATTHAAHAVAEGTIFGAQVGANRAHEHLWTGIALGRLFSQVSGYRMHPVADVVLWGGQSRSYRALEVSATAEMARFHGAQALVVGSVPVDIGAGAQHVFDALEVLGSGVVWGLCVPPRPPFAAHIHDLLAPLTGRHHRTRPAHVHTTAPSERGVWLRHPFAAHEHLLVPVQSGASHHGRAATEVGSDVWMGVWTRAYNAQVVTGQVLFSPQEPGRPTLRQGREHSWPSPDFAHHVRTYTAQDLENYHVVFHVRRLRPRPPPVVPLVRVREIEAQKADAAGGIEKFGVAVYYHGKK